MKAFRTLGKAAAVCAAVALLMPAATLAGDWVTHTNCTLMRNSSNDGDSFHVSVEGKEHIFRLYFVDCPETSRMIPERVMQQATYWDIRETQVLAAGREATRFTAGRLRQPFTVHTRGEDARGQSDLPREFAMIETADGDLATALTDAGLARVYGFRRTLPDGTPAKAVVRRLDALEKTARRKRRGAWKGKATRLSDIRELTRDIETGPVVLKYSITLYTDATPPAFAGTIPRNTTVQVLGAASTMLVRVSFTRDGKETVGLCKRTELKASGVAAP